jgi:hypothetical protein
MKQLLTSLPFAFLFFLATLMAAPTLQASGASEDIPYFCGMAVGEEEQAEDAKSPYSWTLKCIFADEQTRQYLSMVEVTVYNEAGEERMQTLCDGAWIVIALPPGKYKVACVFEGKPVERTITVGTGMKTEYFFW